MIYPENLNKKPMLWLWQLKDLILIILFGMVSVFAAVYLKLVIPLAVVAIYSILSMRIEDVSILDLLFILFHFFMENRTFYWRYEQGE